ncbi:MAG: hypothetical protein A2070_09980 [Bdellovibrionales bacterium GWC1_52_8]|nr:MAG: hypothetical protein A2X97_16590 [Bdellovibrionales bacterium GWA1_52_35]OFZ36352.1 MAG: hypothetical protein A2070_09980 [Bdellovibrionales bacterium GWC1_52_8]HCM38995.1 hypothetical protein [Bdellovibrionales bacterium]
MANVESAVRNIAENEEHHEGRVTSVIEHQTAKIPSIVYLNLAFASMAGSLYIAAKTRKTGWANFVGLWAPSFMLMGIYNKLVKKPS